ncbi:MAG: hypothetical protein FJ035_01200 [Chloroflexi bacterium]|nr:hypothetical protein [Chloroflexota bacterium]
MAKAPPAEAATAALARLKGIVPSTWAGEEVDALSAASGTGALARWTLTASSGLEPEQGNFTDACTVIVRACSEQEALRKARALVPRHWYRVQSVEEAVDA